MPDTKETTPVKRSVWHRPWLPKWLLREGRRSALPSRPKRSQWGSYHRDGDCRASISFPQIPLTDKDAGVSHCSISNTPALDSKGQPTTSSREGRRAASVDRRTRQQYGRKVLAGEAFGSRFSAPEIQWDSTEATDLAERFGSDSLGFADDHYDSATNAGSISPNGEKFKEALEGELEKIWILNLSLRFRNGSDREKFFVTYIETPTLWRRVTVSCNYDRAEPGSLEHDLNEQAHQSEKNFRIYESLRESISQIKFFDTVTNLRLETIDGQLHVNVAEDANEIIPYPTISAAPPLRSSFILESHLTFEAHFSGFAYQVKYEGTDYVKKEMPSPDSVDEFLYEINALYELLGSKNVIQLKAIVVDDTCQVMKGLLLDFATKGDLVGLLEDCEGGISWERRERWAKQIVEGLAEIHEAGFVQGDLTLTNVVVADQDNAKIIDINRRGCPIGWEPPEFKQKLDSKQRISMYIGVKSDLFQLGMILWALAMEIDQPERHPQPLVVPGDTQIPDYYRKLVETCLSHRPKDRLSAKELLEFFPQKQIFPPSAMVQQAAENDALGSSAHYPYQNGAVCPTQILDHIDQCADYSQIAEVPNDPLKTRRTTAKPTPLHCHDGSCTHSRYSLDSNDGPNREDVSCLPNDPGNSEEYLVEPPGLVTGIGSTATRETVPNDICNPGSRKTGSIVEEAELELEAPAHMFSVADPPLASGFAHLSEKIPFPEDLTFIGSHPSCLFDVTSMTEARYRTQPDGLRVSNSSHYTVGQAAHDAVSDIPAPGIPRDTQAIETASVSVTNHADLLSSCLPINPAFVPWTSEAQQHASRQGGLTSTQSTDDHSGKRAEGELRRKTSIATVDDLFTSRLPINPRHNGQGGAAWETPLENLILSSGCEPQSEVSTRAVLSRCGAIVQSEYSSSNTDSLLASALSTNPAAITGCELHVGTMLSGSEDCSTVLAHLSGSDTLLTSRLPINPAVTVV